MDRAERLELMERLRAANAESEAAIEARRRWREENPLAYDVADARLTGDPADLHFSDRSEPIGRRLVRRSGNGAGLVYRSTEDALQQVPESEPADFSGWEAWMAGHLDNLRGEIARAIAETCTTLIKEERAAFDHKLAALERENAELRRRLDQVMTKRLDRRDTLTEKLEADRVGLKTRLARLEGVVSGRLHHLAGLADSAGLLTRGYE